MTFVGYIQTSHRLCFDIGKAVNDPEPNCSLTYKLFQETCMSIEDSPGKASRPGGRRSNKDN